MKTFKTVDEIRKAFMRAGWSDNIHFEKVDDNFKMVETGNIYDKYGKIFKFNVQKIGRFDHVVFSGM